MIGLPIFLLLLSSPEFALPQLSTQRIFALDDSSKAFRENDHAGTLEEFKDSDGILKLKLQNLELVNKSRVAAGLQPVSFDILASRVANKHCREMVELGYVSHWNTRGEKPYHRYARAGGTAAIVENVFSKITSGKFDVSNERLCLEFMNAGHNGFLNEKPPDDYHRRNILDPNHNAIGIGCYLGAKRFSYAQEFLNHYLQVDEFPRHIQAGETITFGGQVLAEKLYPFLLLIYYEPWPEPVSVSYLDSTTIYPDGTENRYLALFNQFRFDEENRRFEVTAAFTQAKPGWYYVRIYLSRQKGELYNSEEGFPATGIMIEVR
ncbi:MAG: CAP domain-containing protein [candidate division KSB1 bacterium]|nr:CAP domain-containing protein [candidate division KSB1 bacterium]MDZ7301026.1 CAP domain-containing protein [candidate division KSB1 bacterium]MDZ7310296.1 CAP domain-containing protein [candidate division KSB1 bacterium]